MNPITDILHNEKIIDQLTGSISGETFADPTWEFNYLGYSKKNDAYIIGTYVYMAGKDGGGFWAFSVKDEKVTIKLSYFAVNESVYGNILNFIKSKYPDTEDLVLD